MHTSRHTSARREQQLHASNLVAHRRSSQLSKTRTRLTTPLPPQHTRDQHKRACSGHRDNKSTTRTSRATLATSTCSNSRHIYSTDCDSTTTTAKARNTGSAAHIQSKRTQQWSYQRRPSRNLSTTANHMSSSRCATRKTTTRRRDKEAGPARDPC